MSTQIAAIAKALLEGQVLSIMDGYKKFACSNLPREISRSIEQKFGVSISREHVKFTSQYGQHGHYFRYRLNPLREGNADGIKAMLDYIREQDGTTPPPKTEAEQKQRNAITTMAKAVGYQQQLFQ